jgi:hypothetical protein
MRHQLAPLWPRHHRPRCRDTRRAFDLRVAKQELNRSQVTVRRQIKGGLGSSKGMGAKAVRVEADVSYPLGDETSVLPRRHTFARGCAFG